MYTMEVGHLAAFIVGMIGEMFGEVFAGLTNFSDWLTTTGGDVAAMDNLTIGIFGTTDGLIYWINNLVFYIIENLPWCDLGQGLGQLIEGILNPPTCT